MMLGRGVEAFGTPGFSLAFSDCVNYTKIIELYSFLGSALLLLLLVPPPEMDTTRATGWHALFIFQRAQFGGAEGLVGASIPRLTATGGGGTGWVSLVF